jgi:hypothetical protein
VESAPDRGTRVAVEVPLRPRDATRESSRGAPRDEGPRKDSDQPDARSTEDSA